MESTTVTTAMKTLTDLVPQVGNRLTGNGVVTKRDVSRCGLHRMKVELAGGYPTLEGWVLTAGCAVVVLGAAWSVTRTVNGMGKALVQFAEVRSSLGHMDRGTRTFPMLRHAHGTRWALAVPSTGSVLMLDEKHEPDRMLIAALGAVCVEGLGVRKVEVIGDR